jgi:hypothetical protein
MPNRLPNFHFLQTFFCQFQNISNRLPVISETQIWPLEGATHPTNQSACITRRLHTRDLLGVMDIYFWRFVFTEVEFGEGFLH